MREPYRHTERRILVPVVTVAERFRKPRRGVRLRLPGVQARDAINPGSEAGTTTLRGMGFRASARRDHRDVGPVGEAEAHAAVVAVEQRGAVAASSPTDTDTSRSSRSMKRTRAPVRTGTTAAAWRGPSQSTPAGPVSITSARCTTVRVSVAGGHDGTCRSSRSSPPTVKGLSVMR